MGYRLAQRGRKPLGLWGDAGGLSHVDFHAAVPGPSGPGGVGVDGLGLALGILGEASRGDAVFDQLPYDRLGPSEPQTVVVRVAAHVVGVANHPHVNVGVI